MHYIIIRDTLANLAEASRCLALGHAESIYLQHCTVPQAELTEVLRLAQTEHRIAPETLPHADLDLYTDSADAMGGLYVGGPLYDSASNMAQWAWDEPDAHINVKEMSAILLGVQHLQLSDVTVRVHTESSVCHRILNKRYTRSRRLQPLLGSILQFCEHSSIQLQVHWVPTGLNPADLPSRQRLGPGPLRTRPVYPQAL